MDKIICTRTENGRNMGKSWESLCQLSYEHERMEDIRNGRSVFIDGILRKLSKEP